MSSPSHDSGGLSEVLHPYLRMWDPSPLRLPWPSLPCQSLLLSGWGLIPGRAQCGLLWGPVETKPRPLLVPAGLAGLGGGPLFPSWLQGSCPQDFDQESLGSIRVPWSGGLLSSDDCGFVSAASFLQALSWENSVLIDSSTNPSSERASGGFGIHPDQPPCLRWIELFLPRAGFCP